MFGVRGSTGRLTRHTTLHPRRRSSSTRCLPMNPVAPVTRARISLVVEGNLGDVVHHGKWNDDTAESTNRRDVTPVFESTKGPTVHVVFNQSLRLVESDLRTDRSRAREARMHLENHHAARRNTALNIRRAPDADLKSNSLTDFLQMRVLDDASLRISGGERIGMTVPASVAFPMTIPASVDESLWNQLVLRTWRLVLQPCIPRRLTPHIPGTAPPGILYDLQGKSPLLLR